MKVNCQNCGRTYEIESEIEPGSTLLACPYCHFISSVTRKPHCWENGPRTEDETSTCMLPADHEGPHVWTLDDDIFVRFPGD